MKLNKLELNNTKLNSPAINSTELNSLNLTQTELELNNYDYLAYDSKLKEKYWSNTTFIFSVGIVFDDNDTNVLIELVNMFDSNQSTFLPNNYQLNSYKDELIKIIENNWNISNGNYHLMLVVLVNDSVNNIILNVEDIKQYMKQQFNQYHITKVKRQPAEVLNRRTKFNSINNSASDNITIPKYTDIKDFNVDEAVSSDNVRVDRKLNEFTSIDSSHYYRKPAKNIQRESTYNKSNNTIQRLKNVNSLWKQLHSTNVVPDDLYINEGMKGVILKSDTLYSNDEDVVEYQIHSIGDINNSEIMPTNPNVNSQTMVKPQIYSIPTEIF